jgi:uncharacterized protein YodC (DUF2158 family)
VNQAALIVLRDFLPPFKIGATVRLRSGSPLMTVTAVENGHVEVKWFEGLSAKQTIFPVGALIAGRKRRQEYAYP